ncbi:hypothetical protein SAY87_016973 [Trapa incisa]|uniref:Uncharacterized protein n=1 Tax=Trapa incisa TaxID=236973 RepID=A0AAN7L6X7_9MYRT|nr:hypothetical protein SAY87_016973 [Trapa incisa]
MAEPDRRFYRRLSGWKKLICCTTSKHVVCDCNSIPSNGFSSSLLLHPSAQVALGGSASVQCDKKIYMLFFFLASFCQVVSAMADCRRMTNSGGNQTKILDWRVIIACIPNDLFLVTQQDTTLSAFR